jgi:hypothetical protein
MEADNNFVVIEDRFGKEKRIRHMTATRDYVCGVCHSPLVLFWREEKGGWVTECKKDAAHDVRKAVTKSSAYFVDMQKEKLAQEAANVRKHLPAYLRDTLQSVDEEGKPCLS